MASDKEKADKLDKKNKFISDNIKIEKEKIEEYNIDDDTFGPAEEEMLKEARYRHDILVELDGI